MLKKLSMLDEKLLTIRNVFTDAPVEIKLSLPELFCKLNADECFDMPYLQAHHADAIYSFFVNLAALCVAHSADGKTVPATAEEWRQAMLIVSKNDESMWELVQSDMSKPGFFQPPTSLTGGTEFSSPDGIDVLITTKSFDIKQGYLDNKNLEYWVYALISCQTLSGYSGSGCQGIVRIQSGYASRFTMSFVEAPFFNTRFKADLQMCISERESIAETYSLNLDTASNVSLLWSVPRDAYTFLELSKCDPFFIEAARVIRLYVKEDGSIYATRFTTKEAMLSKDVRGVVGDIWSPVEMLLPNPKDIGKKEPILQAVNLKESFNFKSLKKFVTDKSIAPLSGSLETNENLQSGFLYLSSMIRGKGKTEGYHRVIVPISKGMLASFSRKTSRSDGEIVTELQARYEAQLTEMEDVWQELVALPLKKVFGTNVDGSKKESGPLDIILASYKKLYQHSADTKFFNYLMAFTAAESLEAQIAVQKFWIQHLASLSEKLLNLANQKLAKSSGDVYMLRARLEIAIRTAKQKLSKKYSLDLGDRMKNELQPLEKKLYAQLTSALTELRRHLGDTGFLADLKRLGSEYYLSRAYQTLKFAIYEDQDVSADDEAKWKILFSSFAKHKSFELNSKSLGQAMADANVSDQRFKKLLLSHGTMLHHELISILNLISNKTGSDFSWLQVACLLFSDGTDTEQHFRQMIANSFYRTKLRASFADAAEV